MIKYIFVNTITTICLILGFLAILFALKGYFYFSFGFGLLAMFCDSLDGFFARLLKAESYFGSIFDTIADIFVYLFYPGVIFYYYFGLNNILVVFISIFIIAGIFRLVKFTINGCAIEGLKKYYIGMPVFFSYIMIIIMMLINLFNQSWVQTTGVILLVFMSIMMLTKYKFRKPERFFLIISLVLILSLSVFMFKI